MVDRRRDDLNVRDLARLLGALADPTRLLILELLASRGELVQKEIVATLRRPQGTIARHLSALQHSGYVSVRRDGRYTHWAATPMPPAVAALIKELGREKNHASTHRPVDGGEVEEMGD